MYFIYLLYFYFIDYIFKIWSIIYIQSNEQILGAQFDEYC